jgi:hypothetical protein
MVELQARVLYILYQKVQENPHGDVQRGFWLMWHPYFYEEAAKYLLLHYFLLYLNKHTSNGRTSKMDINNWPSQRSEEKAGRASGGELRVSNPQDVAGFHEKYV